jgi:hypothetical protein
MTDESVKIEIQAEARGLETAFLNIRTQFEICQGSFKSVEDSMKSAQRTFSETINKFLDAKAFGVLKNSLQSITNASAAWNEQVKNLSKTLGVSAEKAGGISKALNSLNISTQTYRDAVLGLQQSLNSQEEAFNRNGIATRDAGGELLNMQDVMINTLDRLKEMKPGYDRNALAMMAFGESAKDIQDIMKLTNEEIARGTEETRRLGITVDAHSAGAVQRYKNAMNDMKSSAEALKIRLGNELLPTLTRSAATMSNLITSAINPAAKAFGVLNDHLSGATVVSGLALIAINKYKTGLLDAMRNIGGFAQGLRSSSTASAAMSTAVNGLCNAVSSLVTPMRVITLATMAAAAAFSFYKNQKDKANQDRKDAIDDIVRQAYELQNLAQQWAAVDAAHSAAFKKLREFAPDAPGREALDGVLKSLSEQHIALSLAINKIAGASATAYNGESIETRMDNIKNRMISKLENLKKDVKNQFGKVSDEAQKKIKEIDDAIISMKMWDNKNAQGAALNNAFAAPEQPIRPGGVTPPAGGAQGQFDLMAAYSEGYKRRYLADLEAVTEEQAAAYEGRLEDEMSYWKGCLAYAEAGTNEYAAIEQKIMDIGIQINEKRIADHKRMLDEKAADDKRAAAEAEAGRKSAAAARKLAAEQEAREAAAHWKTFYAPMANGYKDALYGMLNGSMNFSDGYKRVLQGMGQALDQFIVEALSSWFSAESKKFIATVTGAGQRVAVEEGASGAVGAAKAVEGAGHETIEIGKTASTAAGAASRTSASLGESLKIIASKAGEGLKHAAVEIGKTMATVAGTIKRVAAVSWEVLTSVALKIWEGLKFVFIEGFQAAAGAFKALVGIPYIGPILAPAAAIAAIAAVASFGSKIASAAGGWGQVPYDQMAMVHKDEMVLPARFAAPLREMLTDTHDGPGAGGGDTYNISIHAIDARSFEQYLKSNRNALVRNIKGATRDNAFFS